MFANIVLNAATTAALGTNLEISSETQVLRVTSSRLGPNGFTQLMRVLPVIAPAAESASLTCPHGTARSTRLQNQPRPAVCPIAHESLSPAQDFPACPVFESS